MKIAVHQPQYIPWMGYFDKIDQADVFVILDDVQFKKNEWQNRNKIRALNDWQWLTVPVEYSFGQKIREIKIDNKNNWRMKHLKSIKLKYSKSPFFNEYMGLFEGVLSKEWGELVELNNTIIKMLNNCLGIDTELLISSDMNISTTRTQRLVDICKKLEADTYLSGVGGKAYLEADLFEKNGITIEYQAYKHPVYKQVYNGFYPYMSIVDLLFCMGKESLEKVREGRVI